MAITRCPLGAKIGYGRLGLNPWTRICDVHQTDDVNPNEPLPVSSAPHPSVATTAAEDTANPATTVETPKLIKATAASTHSSNHNIKYDPASQARLGLLRRTSSTQYDDGGNMNAPVSTSLRRVLQEGEGGDISNLPWYYPVWESSVRGYCKNDLPRPDYHTALGDNPTLFQTAAECCEKWYVETSYHIIISSYWFIHKYFRTVPLINFASFSLCLV